MKIQLKIELSTDDDITDKEKEELVSRIHRSLIDELDEAFIIKIISI